MAQHIFKFKFQLIFPYINFCVFSGFAVYPHFFKDRFPPPYVPLSNTFPKHPTYLDNSAKSHFYDYTNPKPPENPHLPAVEPPFASHEDQRPPKSLNSHFNVYENERFTSDRKTKGLFGENFHHSNSDNRIQLSRSTSARGSSSYMFYPGQKLSINSIPQPRRRKKRRRYGDILGNFKFG